MEVAQSTKLRCHGMEKWYLLASWTSPIFVDKHQCPNCCCSKPRLTKFNSVTKHTFFCILKILSLALIIFVITYTLK